MGIESYNPSASLNTNLGSIPVAENMARGNVSDAFRQLMADISSGVTPLTTPKKYGAVRDGVTNDSGPFVSAITANKQISLDSGASYSIKDVGLSNTEGVVGTGQIFNVASGGTNLFTLSNYNARASGFYVSSGVNASQALFRIKVSRYPFLTNIVAVNCGLGLVKIVPDTPASEAIALPIIDNVQAEDISSIGVDIGSSVSEVQATNLHLYGKLTTGTGGNQRPMFTTTGWRQNTPVVGGVAVGGHQVANANMISFNRGFWLTDAQLSKFTNCIADGASDYGVLIDGASDHIEFSDLFVGTTRGVKVMGTAQNISFCGLKTILTGTIPPWGSTDFFNGVGTFYDLEVRDTAKVRVSAWVGTKRIAVDSTAQLIVDDGMTFLGRSVGTVAVSTTAYLMEAGAQAVEANAVWRAPYDGYLIRITPLVTVAPGAGQSFVYTARVSGVDTALTQTITGAAAFGNVDAWAGTLVPVNKGDSISIKLVTSAGAGVATHQCQLQLVPR